MGRRARKRLRIEQEADGQTTQKRPHNDVQDPALRLIAVQADRRLVALAVGQQLKLADLRSGTQVELNGAAHTGFIRVCRFDPSGKLLLTGGDDKVARLWDTSSGKCIATMPAAKKISAGAFSPDSQYVVFADKFGDVLAARVEEQEDIKAGLMLSHFASFIMSLEVMPDQRYLVSCDRDSKIRVSAFPSDPTKGSYDIQAFCLGHSNFVTSSALLELENETLLLSAGGDGTVRLWRPSTGALLHTQQVGEARVPASGVETNAGDEDAKTDGADPANGKEEEENREDITEAGDADSQQPAGADEGQEKETQKEGDKDDGEEEEQDGEDDEDDDDDDYAELARVSSLGVPARDLTDYAPVLSIAVASDRRTIAVTVEGEQDVVILSFDAEHLSLIETARVAFSDVSYPASVSFDEQTRLWVVGGVPLQTSTALHIGVAQCKGDKWVSCTEEVVETKLRSSLECRNEEEEKALQEGVKFEWYSEHLKKKSYTTEELEFRKRHRNDFRENARLAALKKAEAKLASSATA